jgi:hypothetical protein
MRIAVDRHIIAIRVGRSRNEVIHADSLSIESDVKVCWLRRSTYSGQQEEEDIDG